jgi:hypothetical protein
VIKKIPLFFSGSREPGGDRLKYRPSLGGYFEQKCTYPISFEMTLSSVHVLRKIFTLRAVAHLFSSTVIMQNVTTFSLKLTKI